MRLSCGILEGCIKVNGDEVDRINVSSVSVDSLQQGLTFASRLGKHTMIESPYIILLIQGAKHIHNIRLDVSALVDREFLPMKPTIQWFAKQIF